MSGTFRERRLSLALGVFVLAMCALFVAVSACQIVTSRQSALDHAATGLLNLAGSLVQQAEDTLEMADQITAQLQNLAETGGRSPEARARLADAMAYATAMSPRVSRLWIFDERGHPLVSSLGAAVSGPPVADRTYFAYHRAVSDGTAFLSGPVKGRADGKWAITLSRRINTADGGFGGVVLARIEAEYFSHLYSGFDVGPHGTIGLFNLDGTFLSRMPFAERVIGQNFSADPIFREAIFKTPSGLSRYVSPVDGTPRTSGFRRGARYPIVVLAAMAEADILAGWRRDAALQSAGTGLLVLVLGGFGFWLARQIRRRQEAEAQLAELSVTDALTGLPNRRGFDGHLAAQWASAARRGEALSLVLLDVDRFKAYNDGFGHPEGDACLRRIAAALKTHVPSPGDLAARYGGEEFALILPGLAPHLAMRAAEAVRRHVEGLAIPHVGGVHAPVVTVSLGCATLRPGDGGRIEALIALADAALYDAKRTGRNRCAAARPAAPMDLQDAA